MGLVVSCAIIQRGTAREMEWEGGKSSGNVSTIQGVWVLIATLARPVTTPIELEEAPLAVVGRVWAF